MNCPKCDSGLLYEEQEEEYWDLEDYSVRWRVACPKCNFEGKLWQTYGLKDEEWEEE